MLTGFAAACEHAVGSGVRDFRALFREGLVAARRSLEATRDQLEILRKANVVDAGALGFVELVAGMSDYLDTGIVPEGDGDIELLRGEDSAAGSQQNLEHRYCTECTVTGDDIDRRHLREEASALGSSLVVAGTQKKLRLHLHLNEPAKLFELAARYGTVSGEKADDMQRQQEMAHHDAGRRVAVVIDSAADLPEPVLEALDIHVVPVRLHFGNQSYLDKIGMTPEQFYRELAVNPQHPKTSQPPPGDFRRAFEFLGSHYRAVVYVGLTARVSGTFQSGETAASRAHTHARIITVDSGTAALGQGLIALRAAEVAAAGGDAEAVRQAALDSRARTRTWGCLVTLEFSVRGGRVPRFVKTLSDLFRVTPILAIGKDGIPAWPACCSAGAIPTASSASSCAAGSARTSAGASALPTRTCRTAPRPCARQSRRLCRALNSCRSCRSARRSGCTRGRAASWWPCRTRSRRDFLPAPPVPEHAVGGEVDRNHDAAEQELGLARQPLGIEKRRHGSAR